MASFGSSYQKKFGLLTYPRTSTLLYVPLIKTNLKAFKYKTISGKPLISSRVKGNEGRDYITYFDDHPEGYGVMMILY